MLWISDQRRWPFYVGLLLAALSAMQLGAGPYNRYAPDLSQRPLNATPRG